MKRALGLVLFSALLLAGCGGAPEGTILEVKPDEPLRIQAVAVSSVPETPVPTPMPTREPTPAPTETPQETPAPTQAPSPTPDMPKGEQLIMIAQQYYNYPYTRGGKSPDTGFDPSGFVYWCLKEMEEDVPRRTSAGYAEEERWEKINRLGDCAAGDLLFFKTGDNENINCVCIYLGNNTMIYPSTSKGMVILSEINSYWINAFQWARRVF